MFIRFDSKNVPPYDINGKGTPTTGKRPIVIPTLIKTCKKMLIAIPADASLAK
jgi:hypothetical protein